MEGTILISAEVTQRTPELTSSTTSQYFSGFLAPRLLQCMIEQVRLETDSRHDPDHS